jgi:hypothetical protein
MASRDSFRIAEFAIGAILLATSMSAPEPYSRQIFQITPVPGN